MGKTLISRRKFIADGIKQGFAAALAPSLLFYGSNAFAGAISLKSTVNLIEGKNKRWRLIQEMDREEMNRFEMDPLPWEKTPRDNTYPYVAKKLAPPYTATEIVYMLTVGQYFPWWTHEAPLGGMMISNRGGINYYTGQREFWSALTPDTLNQYLYQWPEDKVHTWIWDRFYTPVRSRCDKLLQNVYRTGKTCPNYSSKWSFYNYSQKTAPEGESLYTDKYWKRDYTYGDTMMVPWYYTWRYLGVDVLSEDDVLRFPSTRPEIEIRNPDGFSEKKATRNISIMGDKYPAYTRNGGVPCYVLEGITNPDFFPSSDHRLILWVDMHAHREIRRERYDSNNELDTITETRNRLERKEHGKWGYSILIHLAWDVKQDHMSVNHYDFHRSPQTFSVNPDQPEEYFRPNPVAMCSEMFPVPLSAMIFREPEQFYLRPKLMLDKFHEDRKISINGNIAHMIEAQEKARRLIFL